MPPLSEAEELEMLELEKEKAMAQGQSSVPDTPVQPARSRADYYLNQAKKGVAGAASIPGLALDAVNLPRRAARAVGSLWGSELPAESPFEFTQLLPDLASKALGVDDIEPPTPLEKIPGLALELGVPSAPMMARNLIKAPHKIPAIAAEVASLFGGSVAGTVGGEAGREMDESFGTEWGENAGEMAGIMGGSLAPTIAPTVLSKIGGSVMSRFSPSARKATAEREAGKVLGPAMTSELDVDENIGLADEATKAINDAVGRGDRIKPLAGTPFAGHEPSLGGKFEPTIGARTGAQVVQELEGGIASSSPERLSRYAARSGQNQRVLDEAKEKLLGGKTAETLPRQAASRLTKAIQELDARIAQAERQQKVLASSTEGGPAQASGEKLREQYWQTRKDVKGKFSALYDQLYSSADEAGVKVDMGDVRDAVKKIAGADHNVYQDMPRTFGKIKREMGGDADLPYPKPANILQKDANDRAQAAAQAGASETSFREFHSLWKEVNRDLGAAARTGDTQRFEYLKQLKGALDAKLAQIEGGGLGDFSESFKAVNKAYGERYAKVFKEGIGGRVANVGKFGASMDDAKVVERFFTPDGMDDFTAIYGADKNAHQWLKDGVLGLFAKQAVDEVTGKIKPGAAESFLRKNAEALDKVPEVKDLLGNAAKSNEALIERSSRLDKARRGMDKTILAKVAGSENVGDVIANASKSPKEMKRLFAIARTKEERVALARSLADELPNIAQKAGMEPYKYLLSQEGTLKPILDQLGPKHWNNLRIIAGGQTLQGRMQVPGRVDIKRGQDPLFEATGSSARSLVSTYLSVLRGRTQPHSEISQIFARFGIKKREQMIDNIMNEAIYDPEMADAIVKIKRGKPDDIVANKFRHYVETAAFRTAVVAGDDQDDESQPQQPPKTKVTPPQRRGADIENEAKSTPATGGADVEIDKLVVKHAARTGVDANFLRAQIKTESSWNQKAVGSGTGRNNPAEGIAQILKSEAAKAGIDPYNPDQAIGYMADRAMAALKQHKGNYREVAGQYHGWDKRGPATRDYQDKVMTEVEARKRRVTDTQQRRSTDKKETAKRRMTDTGGLRG